VVRDVVVGAMIKNFDGEAEFLKSWSKYFLVAEKRPVRSWRTVRDANFPLHNPFKKYSDREQKMQRGKRGNGHFSYLIYIWVLCPRLPSSE
jgi:hypothetical protein